MSPSSTVPHHTRSQHTQSHHTSHHIQPHHLTQPHQSTPHTAPSHTTPHHTPYYLVTATSHSATPPHIPPSRSIQHNTPPRQATLHISYTCLQHSLAKRETVLRKCCQKRSLSEVCQNEDPVNSDPVTPDLPLTLEKVDSRSLTSPEKGSMDNLNLNRVKSRNGEPVTYDPVTYDLPITLEKVDSRSLSSLGKGFREDSSSSTSQEKGLKMDSSSLRSESTPVHPDQGIQRAIQDHEATETRHRKTENRRDVQRNWNLSENHERLTEDRQRVPEEDFRDKEDQGEDRQIDKCQKEMDDIIEIEIFEQTEDRKPQGMGSKPPPERSNSSPVVSKPPQNSTHEIYTLDQLGEVEQEDQKPQRMGLKPPTERSNSTSVVSKPPPSDTQIYSLDQLMEVEQVGDYHLYGAPEYIEEVVVEEESDPTLEEPHPGHSNPRTCIALDHSYFQHPPKCLKDVLTPTEEETRSYSNGIEEVVLEPEFEDYCDTDSRDSIATVDSDVEVQERESKPVSFHWGVRTGSEPTRKGSEPTQKGSEHSLSSQNSPRELGDDLDLGKTTPTSGDVSDTTTTTTSTKEVPATTSQPRTPLVKPALENASPVPPSNRNASKTTESTNNSTATKDIPVVASLPSLPPINLLLKNTVSASTINQNASKTTETTTRVIATRDVPSATSQPSIALTKPALENSVPAPTNNNQKLLETTVPSPSSKTKTTTINSTRVVEGRPEPLGTTNELIKAVTEGFQNSMSAPSQGNASGTLGLSQGGGLSALPQATQTSLRIKIPTRKSQLSPKTPKHPRKLPLQALGLSQGGGLSAPSQATQTSLMFKTATRKSRLLPKTPKHPQKLPLQALDHLNSTPRNSQPCSPIS
ncbi:uncharacterized protein LOC126991716 [Eriocheir sinensis]|uniref:uncharacterized protein LOC126991716 n=1 Tax=Eriocheir sinensis TaxID=95602 RepID=UPI0021C6DF45|nr:uncharacterized protein LOC126991716 [Eriocheir sinensis]